MSRGNSLRAIALSICANLISALASPKRTAAPQKTQGQTTTPQWPTGNGGCRCVSFLQQAKSAPPGVYRRRAAGP